MSGEVNLSDDAVVMATQQGVAHGQLAALRLPRHPESKEFIRSQPIYRQLVESHAEHTVASQGRGILRWTKSPVHSILDIGCGLGLCSLSLYRELEEKPMLYLCDGINKPADQDTVYCASFAPDGDNMVTDIRVTLDFLLSNGVAQEHINIVAPDELAIANLNHIDLVVSNVSWCYHYPPEVYWTGVSFCMHPRSMMKVDIRVGDYADSHPEYVDFFNSRFHLVEEMELSGTPQRPDKTLSIMAQNPR